MNKDNKKSLVVIAAILGVVILLVWGGILPLEKFVITDDDFGTSINSVNFTTADVDGEFVLIGFVNNSMNFSYGGKYYLSPSGKVYYKIDNNTNLVDLIPSLTDGVHTVIKYKITSLEGNTIMNIENWELTTLVQNQIVNQTQQLNVTSEQLCTALNGTYANLTCTCPNGDKWFDNSTSKVCGPVIKTETKTKEVEVPVEATFFQKYGLAIIILVGASAVIIYMGAGKRRKK